MMMRAGRGSSWLHRLRRIGSQYRRRTIDPENGVLNSEGAVGGAFQVLTHKMGVTYLLISQVLAQSQALNIMLKLCMREAPILCTYLPDMTCLSYVTHLLCPRRLAF